MESSASRVKKFSFYSFAAFGFMQLVATFAAIRYLAPSVWERELATGAGAITATFLVVHFINGFLEHLLHRYLLHCAPFGWLKYFTQQHRKHHGLTHVVRLDPKKSGASVPIRNRYPIEETEQHEASAFPPYALGLFLAIFTLFFILIHKAFPGVPIFFGGYLAVFWSYGLYETLHAIEHLPYAFWEKKIEHPILGRIWGWFYSVHLGHHLDIKRNEGIGGFFGLPVADWAFRTYKVTRELPLNGRFASADDFSSPRPCWLIRVLDRLASQAETRRRSAHV